jgi:glycosyltransferase involved in cell wall biosynthesis
MRVAFVGTEIPDHCIEFADMMADSCDVLLCIPDRYFTPKRVRPKARLQVDWLPWPRKRDPRNIVFTRTVARHIRAWKPDIVHFLSESNVWNWLLVRYLKSSPVVTTVHDLTFHLGDADSRRIPRFFANALIKKSDAIIVHGEALRNDAVRLLPVRPEQVNVVPLVPPLLPSFDTSEFAEQANYTKPGDGIFRILFFGRIYEYKGLRYLLEAMPIVRKRVKNARLVIAGEGDDISGYRNYITDPSYLEIRNRFIPRPEVAQLFIEADLLVLPYIEASQSGPLMIAMAFGLPVVTTEVGEMPNVVRSADSGLIVPPKDKLALANAICKVALDRDLRHRFSDNAKRAMNDDYSRGKISAQVQRIYQELLDRHAR